MPEKCHGCTYEPICPIKERLVKFEKECDEFFRDRISRNCGIGLEFKLGIIRCPGTKEEN